MIWLQVVVKFISSYPIRIHGTGMFTYIRECFLMVNGSKYTIYIDPMGSKKGM